MFTDEVIALLNEKFVPFLPHWRWRQEHTTFQAILRPHVQQAKQGLYRLKSTPFWIASSAGEPLGLTPGGRSGNGKPTGMQVAAALRTVLANYAMLPEAKRRPEQPIADASHPMPAPPPGGLVLTVYDRFLLRDPQGHYGHLPSKWLLPYDQGRFLPTSWQQVNKKNLPALVLKIPAERNNFWLTEAEWRSLLPEKPEKGQSHAVPERLTKRLLLYGLWFASAQNGGGPWGGDSLRTGELQLTVEDVSPRAVRMRIHGSVLLLENARWPTGAAPRALDRLKMPREQQNRYDANLEGTISYDPVQKRIINWDMVALGDYSGFVDGNQYECYSPVTPPIPYGFSFELDQSDYELPAERRRHEPYALLHLKTNDYYWFPEKYQEDWKKRKKKN